MSLTKCLYHIVISTYNRQMTIPEASKRQLYAYMFGIIKSKRCELLRMNGIGDHIHMLVDLAPDISLSNFMRDLKRSSSLWAGQNKSLFPDFDGWSKEYYAFSCSESEKDSVVHYIIAQEDHHNVITFYDEMLRLAALNRCELFRPEGDATSST